MWRTVVLLLAMACQPRGPVSTTDTGTPSDTDVPTTTDTDTDTPTTDTETTGNQTSACLEGPATAGPWDDHPITSAGRTTTADPYAFDAGLDDVIAAADGQTTEVAVSIAVDGAVVTSVDYVPMVNDGTGTFWLEDANGAIQAFRVDTGDVDPFDLKPGDKVSFTATEVLDYFGTIEVTAATDFQVIGVEPVHIVDGNGGAALDFDVNGLRTVEVWGELVSGPTDCGANCFDMSYAGGTITFRSDSTFDVVGDCIHYIGPLSQFSGDEQLDAGNFDWYRAF